MAATHKPNGFSVTPSLPNPSATASASARDNPKLEHHDSSSNQMPQPFTYHTQPRLESTLNVPIELLQDLAAVHHLLSQDTAEPELLAEQATIETFCSFVWGRQTATDHFAAAAAWLGRPKLSTDEKEEARKLPHGEDCLYRNRGIDVFEDVVERMSAVDNELGMLLASCRGGWMVSFRVHQ